MTLHQPRLTEKTVLDAIESVKRADRAAAVAPRLTMQYLGFPVSYAHSRRPRILRLEPSKPRPGSTEIDL